MGAAVERQQQQFEMGGAAVGAVAVRPAIAGSISSATAAMISSISRRLSAANSAGKLWSFRSRPNSAQTRVPATRKG